MPSAGVISIEKDLSTSVPQFPGVYGGIVIKAKKGEVNQPFLVTSETEFLKVFTPNEKIEAGYDTAHFDALAYLEKSNKLWVVRAAKDALYGGIVVASESKALETGETTANKALVAGLASVASYTFGTDEVMLIHGANPGAWNNDISIKIITTNVNESGAFIIEVYKGGALVESHLCSQTLGHKDGFGNNLFVEDVLKSSIYIRALNNSADNNDPYEQTTELSLASGADGSETTNTEIIAALNTLNNPESLPLTVVMDGGYITPEYQAAIKTLCEGRADCVGVLSSSNKTTTTEIIAGKPSIDSSWVAMYSPWVKIYDKFNDREVEVSPSGYAAAAISYSGTNYELWYPPAGNKRGKINVLDVKKRFSKGEMDNLAEAGINPIRYKPGKGITIWGQDTLTGRPSALKSFNVRLLLIVIRPAIAEALEDFVFELNDIATRQLVTSMVESYMDNIKARRGVYEYKVVCDSTNNTPEDIDNERMNLWVFIKPTRGIKEIKFQTVITKNGLDFKLAEQAL